MKHKLINLAAVLVIIAGVVVSAVAPWWAVWFICLPVVYAAAIYLVKSETNFIEEA